MVFVGSGSWMWSLRMIKNNDQNEGEHVDGEGVRSKAEEGMLGQGRTLGFLSI